MRTYTIVLSTIVVCLLVGLAGYWLGTGKLARHDAIFAEVDKSCFHIISQHPGSVEIRNVTFNDSINDACTSSSHPMLYKLTQSYSRDWQGNVTWTKSWGAPQQTVMLSEGDVAGVAFDRALCGGRLVKARVETSLGTYVFRDSAKIGDRGLVIDRWSDLHDRTGTY